MGLVTYDSRGNASGVSATGVLLIVLALVALITVPMSFETVSKGTVKAGYRFGKYTETIGPGFHFPVNPLVSWTEVDVQDKTMYLEHVTLPSRDQLLSSMDVSVQYRAISTQADAILSGTGSVEQVVSTHLDPNIRSLLRQAGRGIEKAEMLFDDTVVATAAQHVLEGLQPLMRDKGFEVTAVLFRNIQPPDFITAAIQKKKEREQLAEQQKAELMRYETEQQQKVKAAQAELDASAKEAEKIKMLADAEAYRIEAINKAVANNPAYVQLQSLEALKQMSKDPAQKLVIMDGSSARPIPFLNLGDALNK